MHTCTHTHTNMHTHTHTLTCTHTNMHTHTHTVVQDLTAQPLTSTSLLISWDPPVNAEDDITYNVFIRKIDGLVSTIMNLSTTNTTAKNLGMQILLVVIKSNT